MHFTSIQINNTPAIHINHHDLFIASSRRENETSLRFVKRRRKGLFFFFRIFDSNEIVMWRKYYTVSEIGHFFLFGIFSKKMTINVEF